MPSQEDLIVYSPTKGAVVQIENVPDPVFAEKMLGDGLAINPAEGIVYSPFDGIVKTLHKALHAVVIEKNGIEILIHIGLETVNLQGKGFTVFVKEGQEVTKGQKLVEFDKEFIAANAPSNYVIVIIANNTEIHPDKTKAAQVDAGSPLFSIGEALPAAQKVEAAQGDCIFSDTLEVPNKNGFHARPASVIAKIAAAYPKADIQLIKGEKAANAKSMVEVLGLGIDYQDQIRVRACGEGKEAAVKELAEAIKIGLNESAPNADKIVQREKPDFTKEVTLKGVGIYPSLALGQTFLLVEKDIQLVEEAQDATEESLRLDAAIAKVKQDINREIELSKDQKSKSEILKAHLSMLDDAFLLKIAREQISQNKTAAFAWQNAIKQSIDVLNSTGNKLLIERAADYTDVKTRIVMELLGAKPQVPVFPKDSIIVASDLLPYQLSYINENVKGVIMALGSGSSHVSIMLKNMGMPTIIGLGADILTVPDGTNVILNSQNDTVTFNPHNIDVIKKEIEQEGARRAINKQHAKEPAITKDGVEINVMGNVGSAKESAEAFEHGSEGLGLVRTEFIFSASSTAPTEEEQYEIYQKIADAQHGKPVIIRLFDVGGDKPLSYLPLPHEDNPIMGMRGIRNYKINLELFKAQVRAVLRVKPYGIARIMLPMVSFIDEIVTYKELIRQEERALNIPKSPVGIMVEVPSAAILADEFALYADFFSIGSNDLTQYTLAIDRGNSNLSTLADSLNPAVLTLIKKTVEGAAKHNRSVGVCGAMASDIVSVAVLIGLGIRDLGVVSTLIPDVKAFIRSVNISDCQKIAKIALEEAQGAVQVRRLVKDEFKL